MTACLATCLLALAAAPPAPAALPDAAAPPAPTALPNTAPPLADAATPTVVRLDPPEHGFYAKQVDYRGIPIKAHADVADEALFVAHDRLARMLGRLDAAVANLRDAGVELHLIGARQVTSDLPENRHLKGKPYDGQLTIDERTRGTGGRLVSCGEENLLGLRGDRYAGRGICLHEFAHALMTYGLSPDVRRRIADQHRRSVARGLWKNAYAATHPQEFLAELTMWYFGTHGDLGMDPKPGIGPGGLRRYDPEAFALLDDLYGGRIPVARSEPVRLAALPRAREADLRSADGVVTAIRFRNETGRPLQFHWIDAEGNRKLYGVLAPGETRDQETFSTHVWLITDAEGRALALYVAGPKPGTAVIQEPPAGGRNKEGGT